MKTFYNLLALVASLVVMSADAGDKRNTATKSQSQYPTRAEADKIAFKTGKSVRINETQSIAYHPITGTSTPGFISRTPGFISRTAGSVYNWIRNHKTIIAVGTALAIPTIMTAVNYKNAKSTGFKAIGDAFKATGQSLVNQVRHPINGGIIGTVRGLFSSKTELTHGDRRIDHCLKRIKAWINGTFHPAFEDTASQG